MQLVADIGGTNARLALVDGAGLRQTRSFKNAAFAGFDDLVSCYLQQEAIDAPCRVVAAVAGPVDRNEGRLTNLAWNVSGAQVSRRFGGAPVTVINDLTALGYAVLGLDPDQLDCLVSPSVHSDPSEMRVALVVGIGTGFNVSPVIAHGGHITCPAVEMGHVSVPSRICRKLEEIAPGASGHFNTIEDLFSGRGRRRFVSLVVGQEIERATPYLAAFGRPNNHAFDRAFDHYTALIGDLLLDLRLAFRPKDGIFLAGGVTRSALDHGRAGLLQAQLEAPEPFLADAPGLYVIRDDAAALKGCARVSQGI